MRLTDKKRVCFLSRQTSNQDGFILILTMVMLATLSILGVMVLNTTDTELSITTNSRMNSDAFIAGETAIQYSQQKIIDDYSAIDETVNYDLIDDDDDIAAILPDGITFEAEGRNEVDFYTGNAPTGMLKGTSVEAYESNIYRTTDPLAAAGGDTAYYRVSVDVKNRGRSSARIETLFVNRGGHVF